MWGPLIAVVIIAPLVAYGLVSLATGDDGTPEQSSPETSQEAGETAPPEGEGEGTEAPGETAPGEEPTEEPTAEEPPPPPLDQEVAVSVLNGASVQGLAGQVGETLAEAGWTGATTGNYQSAQPEISTIFYADPDLLDEAQALGELLGIGNVVELGDVPSITVVLRPDFVG
ncbi:hypothetical protein C8046_15885 [Serinibacter arcticus]|uniref:LytR/CpsA/Psr regulator C-terminal domain-containing protein n=1 Tax=Serinibacter arcticus TaxID=1655435 RepID=A0A2U1ZYA8_9MICO|nr:hypothetical protein C8046_15885 [Serinibacter arcticus]